MALMVSQIDVREVVSMRRVTRASNGLIQNSISCQRDLVRTRLVNFCTSQTPFWGDKNFSYESASDAVCYWNLFKRVKRF